MDASKKPMRPRMVAALMETFGLSPSAAFIVSCFILLVALAAIAWVFLEAPPRTITISSGPPGSSFERYALAYQKALATHGLNLRILPSGGSPENLQRLEAPNSGVDLAFVQSGLSEGFVPRNLVSLGSIANQPLWLFYKDGGAQIQRLSELAGKRIAVGPVGSGARALALTLLRANGVTSDNATLLDDDADVASKSLLAGTVDAAFMMGDSAPIQTLRTLVHAPHIEMYSWTQADAYSRRFAYLNKMTLPQGSIDLGTNLPRHDVALVGPAVELVTHKGLHSAISDVVLMAAQEVHGKPNILQRRGEFPAPIEPDFKLSDDAKRFYKSGPSFLLRNIRSFWVASLINPILVAFIPAILVLVPVLRVLPIMYRMRIHLKIYRCYRPLLQLERDASGPLTRDRAQELLRRLDDVERIADRLRVPASFGDQFYELRGHILFVRNRLRAAVG